MVGWLICWWTKKHVFDREIRCSPVICIRCGATIHLVRPDDE